LIETPRSKYSDLDLFRNKTAIQYPEYGNGSIFTIRYIQMFSGRPLLAKGEALESKHNLKHH
jgi:hypothetical protein